MIKTERQDKLLEIVGKNGYVTLGDISKALSISESTIRRDIVELDQQGKLKRERGGASALNLNGFQMIDQKLAVREKIEAAAKERIARKALSFIKPDMSIYLDSGSTPLILAKSLPKSFPLTVVTPAFSIAQVIAQKGIRVYLIGGQLKLTTDAMVGPLAEEMVKKFKFNLGFLGANAVSPQRGFSTPDVMEANMKVTAARCADVPIFLVDKTKFGTDSVYAFFPLQGATAITDFEDRDGQYQDLTIVEAGK